MKISEIIEGLLVLQVEYGDIECITAIDDEGNGYNKCYYDPSIYFQINGDEADRTYRQLCQLEDVKQDHIDDYENGEEDKDFEPLEIKYFCCLN